MSNTTKLTFPLLVEALQVLFKIYLKVSSFWLKPCSPCEYSFGTLVWFETRLFHWSWLTFIPFPSEHELLIPKLASLQHIPVGRCCFSETVPVFSAFSWFFWKGCLLETGQFKKKKKRKERKGKLSAWLHWDQDLSFGLAGIFLPAVWIKPCVLKAVWKFFFTLGEKTLRNGIPVI